MHPVQLRSKLWADAGHQQSSFPLLIVMLCLCHKTLEARLGTCATVKNSVSLATCNSAIELNCCLLTIKQW